jgi:hypothetical protein
MREGQGGGCTASEKEEYRILPDDTYRMLTNYLHG